MVRKLTDLTVKQLAILNYLRRLGRPVSLTEMGARGGWDTRIGAHQRERSEVGERGKRRSRAAITEQRDRSEERQPQ